LDELLQLIVKLTQQLMQGRRSVGRCVLFDFLQNVGGITKRGKGEAHMIGCIPNR